MISFLQRLRRKILPPSVDAFDGRIDRIEALIGALFDRAKNPKINRQDSGRVHDFHTVSDSQTNHELYVQRNIMDVVEKLVKKTNEKNEPNINELWFLTRDIELVKLNIKSMGYQLARDLAKAFPKHEKTSPKFVGLSSRATRQEEFEQEGFVHWCNELKIPVIYHRKLWEYGFVLQSLFDCGLLENGKKGIGFGCGQEPLPSYFASLGMKITVTDLHPDLVEGLGWTETGQHSSALESTYFPELVSRDSFDSNVTLRFVDMNNIPGDLVGFDFCWSICALEHLGSIEKGLNFIENSLNCLNPGGIALHTTEFNYLDDKETIDNWMTVLFQRKHFEAITSRLTQKGHVVAPLNFDVGDDPMDTFIDLPPYAWQSDLKDRPHLKLSVDGFACTCFGLAIKKAI